MNEYPFAGPGGQKTLHRQAAAAHALPFPLDWFCICYDTGDATAHQVYTAVMEYDNR